MSISSTANLSNDKLAQPVELSNKLIQKAIPLFRFHRFFVCHKNTLFNNFIKQEMKSFIFTLLIAALTFSATAQTAEEIVAKHIQAIGGKDALTQTKSVYIESSMSMMGTDAPSRLYILNGKGYKNEIDMMGSTIIQCVTENAAWSVNPLAGGGVQDMPEKQAKSSLANLSLGGVFVDYAAKGTKVELIGKKKMGDNEAYELKVTPKDSDASTYFIDAKTYYITRLETKGEMMGQDVNINTNFSDFKKLENGYVMPHTTQIEMGQFDMKSTVSKVELNKPIDETIFAKPK